VRAGGSSGHLPPKPSWAKCCALAHIIDAAMVAIKVTVQFRNALFTVNLPGPLQQREPMLLPKGGELEAISAAMGSLGSPRATIAARPAWPPISGNRQRDCSGG